MIRKFHAYWGGRRLSWLRYLTLKTFIDQNPDWEVNLYTPSENWTGAGKWPDPPHKVRYTGPDWMPAVSKLDVNVEVIDFEKIGFTNKAHPAHKSDFLRWHLLDTIGGFWSDMDVLYFHPLPSGDLEKFDFSITADVWPAIYYIAYIYAIPHTDITRQVRKAATQHYREDQYQCLGCAMLQQLWPDGRRFHIYHPGLRVGLVTPKANIPVPWGDVGRFFVGHMDQDVDLSDSVGLHFFGGHELSETWENILTEKEIYKHDSLVCHVLRAIVEKRPVDLLWKGKRDDKERGP